MPTVGFSRSLNVCVPAIGAKVCGVDVVGRALNEPAAVLGPAGQPPDVAAARPDDPHVVQLAAGQHLAQDRHGVTAERPGGADGPDLDRGEPADDVQPVAGALVHPLGLAVEGDLLVAEAAELGERRHGLDQAPARRVLGGPHLDTRLAPVAAAVRRLGDGEVDDLALGRERRPGLGDRVQARSATRPRDERDRRGCGAGADPGEQCGTGRDAAGRGRRRGGAQLRAEGVHVAGRAIVIGHRAVASWMAVWSRTSASAARPRDTRARAAGSEISKPAGDVGVAELVDDAQLDRAPHGLGERAQRGVELAAQEVEPGALLDLGDAARARGGASSIFRRSSARRSA